MFLGGHILISIIKIETKLLHCINYIPRFSRQDRDQGNCPINEHILHEIQQRRFPFLIEL